MSLNTKYHDELSLLIHLREDDVEAFRFIYVSFYDPLMHYAVRFTKNRDQSEDIISESFIALWQQRKKFETLKGISAFLYSCIRNNCITYIRKEKRHSKSHNELSYLMDQEERAMSVEDIKTDLIQCSLIEAAALPPAMKRVFQLSYIEGFSTSQIAEKLQLSVLTIRAQKVSAVKKVRERLAKKGLLSWLF